MRYDFGPATEHVRWCLSQLRFKGTILKERLKMEDVYEDYLQEMYATGFIAWKMGMDIKETRRYAGRQIAAFLKSYGFTRYRNVYVKALPCFTEVCPEQWQVDYIKPIDNGTSFTHFSDEDLTGPILRILGQHSEGLARAEISGRLGVSVADLEWYLAALLRDGRIILIPREWGGRARHPAPLLALAVAAAAVERELVPA